jgi:hypothetical protein
VGYDVRNRQVGTLDLNDVFIIIPKLGYLALVLQECYRSNLLSRLGIPHASIEDDIYSGMIVPKGTIVYQDVWAVTHYEPIYSKLFDFWLERYLHVNNVGNEEPFPTGKFSFARREVVLYPPAPVVTRIECSP